MFILNLALFVLNLFFGVRSLVKKDYGFLTWVSLVVAVWCGYDLVRAF